MKFYLTNDEKAIIKDYVIWCKHTNREPDGRNVSALLEKWSVECLECINDLIGEYMAGEIK